ncbi:hypothetical protein NQ315_012252 [Exocentrus adspersus]|uniref:CCHC-type domain-containing protein n=1 Tax=Exocentrus adspersus TaxID=1586481 RepID=A0AAV8VEY2_9CUCU|nr:hypothetical protein NQ315_012252 [Exocentrus adspersus]
MTAYYFGKMELLRTCQITGKNAISCLIDGIQDITTQNAARAGRYVMPETLFEEYLSMLQKDKLEESKADKSTTVRVDLRNSLSRKRHTPYSKPEDKDKNLTCFNCKMKGHYQSKCPKPRIECTKCHMLGHEAARCVVGEGKRRVSKGESDIIINLTNSNPASKNNTCYFIDCVINGKSLRGYVDSGCAAVTIRETIATELNLLRKQTSVRLYGYAGGSVLVTSKVTLNLEVDLAKSQVVALVVPDHVQEVPVIIGQPFINDETVTVVVRGNQIRLFQVQQNMGINEAPLKKINLYTHESFIIPSNHVGHISVYGAEHLSDAYVDLQYRNWDNNFHVIVPCVTNLKHGGHLTIINMSDKSICYGKDKVVARGHICHEDLQGDSINCLRTTSTVLTEFTLNDIQNQMNPELNNDEQSRLLRLLNEYRDCFADTLAEVGKSDVTELSIKLSDDDPSDLSLRCIIGKQTQRYTVMPANWA